MERELTITLSDDDARFFEEQVKAGAYATVGDAVEAAVRSARAVETDASWVRAKVKETLDDARPSVSAREAFTRVREHIASHS